jgi:hypothetical protein
VDLRAGNYSAVEFKVYAANSRTSISLQLENGNRDSFPQVNHGRVQQGRWVTISIPFSELNPNNLEAHRLSIKDVSGSSKTYYVDEIRLVK